MMAHFTCCVQNCKNTSNNSNCKFYTFPNKKYEINRKNNWIKAIQTTNQNFSWKPKIWHRIGSVHFVGNCKSNIESHPGYVPSLFYKDGYQQKQVNQEQQIKRHERLMRRRIKTQAEDKHFTPSPAEDNIYENQKIDEQQITSTNKECQVSFVHSDTYSSTFICNRFVYNNVCEAQTQTDIAVKIIIHTSNKKYNHKQCGTEHKEFTDKCVGPDDVLKDIYTGFNMKAVKRNEELMEVTGVDYHNFNFLLKRTENVSYSKINKENRLLIFLMKMKTGLTFAALGVIFNVHRTTISRIFFSVLGYITAATRNLVFWPRKDVVQGTMPECFKPQYSSTRVIIDCTELKIESPHNVDHRVLTYSNYKGGFTAKVLIGCTPNGFISFKSKVSGGRKSDSQMTIESGFIDLLEEGDTVLADKGFPDIVQKLDESGKRILLVMPPFLERGKNEFTRDETEATYQIAKVRIHIERIMQRLKNYRILQLVPVNLFPVIDDILHVCCCLVNLQDPIISIKDGEIENETNS